MSERRSALIPIVCALLAAAPAAAWGEHRGKHGRDAEAAIARGLARPVGELLQRVRSTFPGSVLKVELEHERGHGASWVYEVKLLTPQGDVVELEYDARTLELLGREGRYREHEHDDH